MVQQCAGCELPIADKFLLKVLDRVWHVNCVQCCECKCTLTEKCFSREGRLFCRKDFYRRYGTKCAGCTQGISPNDMVRRARNLVFHVDCFICSVCKRQIATGDELYYIGGCNFICKEDFYHAGKITQTESEKDLGFGLDDDLEAALGGKRRGPRTTIKAKQLEALKSTFAATPKPTRNIREKLAQETGLNMRVIQVWFQNRRSKERRLKQQGSSQQSTSQNRSRSHRRTRSARLDSSDSLEENQSINTPHLQDYQPQDIPTHVPPSPSPQYLSIPVSQYNNGYYSKSDAVSEVITSMNATDMPPSGYTARPLGVTQLHSNGSPGSTLSPSEHFSHHTNSNTGTGQPQNTLISPPSTEVW